GKFLGHVQVGYDTAISKNCVFRHSLGNRKRAAGGCSQPLVVLVHFFFIASTFVALSTPEPIRSPHRQ
ncbi:MAG: hypothetical protein ACFFCW_24100, partial [Candidatus Hodarchaeota archaeon]